MNLWANAQKQQSMLVKILMLNFRYKFFNNTSIPIVPENDSIINTVNIDEGL
jgi:hypothetical protein